MVATYILLMKRAFILFGEQEYLDEIKNIEDKLSQITLKFNPLGAGEALRALTYPIESYRVIKAPKSWIQDDKFLKFMPFFLHRFVIDYTDESTEWQICNFKACELKGFGIDEFLNALTPANEGGQNG